MLEYTKRRIAFPPSPDNGFADTLLEAYNGECSNYDSNILCLNTPRDGLPSLPRQTMGLLTHYCRLTMGRPNQVQWGRKSSPHNIKLMAYSTEGFP